MTFFPVAYLALNSSLLQYSKFVIEVHTHGSAEAYLLWITTVRVLKSLYKEHAKTLLFTFSLIDYTALFCIQSHRGESGD